MAEIKVIDVKVNYLNFSQNPSGTIDVDSSISITLDTGAVHNVTIQQLIGIEGVRMMVRRFSKYIKHGVRSKEREFNNN